MYEQMFIRTHNKNAGKLCGDLFLVEMWSHHPKRGVESGESSLPELYLKHVVNLCVGGNSTLAFYLGLDLCVSFLIVFCQ